MNNYKLIYKMNNRQTNQCIDFFRPIIGFIRPIIGFIRFYVIPLILIILMLFMYGFISLVFDIILNHILLLFNMPPLYSYETQCFINRLHHYATAHVRT